MVFVQKSMLNRNERVLLYLLDNPYQFELPDAPEDLTAFGIADAISSNRSNIFYNLNELKNKGYLVESVKYIKGKKKKQKIYSLSKSGKSRAKDLKDGLCTKEITILSPDKKSATIMFPDVSKYLQTRNICKELSDLEICKYTHFNGILDINFLTELNVDSLEFPSSIINPKIFFGRERELDQLKTWIDKKKKYNYIIMYGTAGIGKTTLMSKLIENYKGKMNIFWYSINEWDTQRSVVSKIFEFISRINKNHLSKSLTQNNYKNSEKTIALLNESLKEINAMLIFDDLHKVKQELRDLFTKMIKTISQNINCKFIFLTRYNIPFYGQSEVLTKKNVVEFELKGLDFENSIEILRRKGIPKKDFKEIFKITAGNPLLLEIIDSDNKTKKYIYEEVFSKLSKKEHMVMEILSIFRGSAPYDALFFNKNISPDIIEKLKQKSIIKLDAEGLYFAHEYIKDYFYKRLNPHVRNEYHNHCAKYMINNKSQDYLEIFYHLLKAKEYQKAIDVAFSKSQEIIHEGYSEKFLGALEEFPEVEIPIDNFGEFLILKAKLNLILGNWEKSLEFYNKAIEESIQSGNDSTKSKAYCEIGHILEEKNLFDEALKNFKKSLGISKIINDPRLIAESNRGIGRYYWRKGNYDDAELYYTQCLNVLKFTNNSKLIGTIKIDIGNVYFEKGNYNQAIDSILAGLECFEKDEDKLEIARANNSLGTVYTYKKDYEKAIYYLKRHLDIVETIKDNYLYGYALSNLGYCYAKSDQIEKAEEYINRAKEKFDKINNENILFIIYRTFGLISQHNKDWKNAINNFKESLDIIRKLNVPLYLAMTLFEFGLMYEEKKDFKQAKKHFIEVKSIYKKMKKQIPDDLKEKLIFYNINQ
ncbi:MAG: tetratricopeptide repeat protein [Candidatus Thorarchaeota archaeon]